MGGKAAPVMKRDERILSILNETAESIGWHNPYDQELREQDSIRRGDTEALKRCWEEKYEGSIGTLAADPLRNIKNIAIGVITLSSRSAIKGGLNPETVFSLADAVILNIEQKLKTPEEVLETIHRTQLTLTEMVSETQHSDSFNPIISRTKDYIFRNIHRKITVTEIAKWLGINPDYLSDLFRRTEKITVTEYIMKEKMELCCNMLKFSNYSIQQISAYFGFCSQSHFTKQFKKVTGMTPGAYRKMYAVADYSNNI